MQINHIGQIVITKKVSYITFVRNVIHHRVDYTKAGLEYTDDEFKSAIDTMRSYL